MMLNGERYGELYQTSNLGQFFCNPEYNRDVPESAIVALAKKIKDRNLLRYNPILVSDKGEIYDGQTRWLAAQRLNLPITFMIANGEFTKGDVGNINQNRRNWEVQDWLKYYESMDYPDYIRLRAISEANDHIGLTNLIYLFYLGSNRAKAKKVFAAGNFQLDETRKFEVQEVCNMVKDYLNLPSYGIEYTRMYRNCNFSLALDFLRDRDIYPHKVILRRLKAYKFMVYGGNLESVFRFLEDIKNHKMKIADKVSYVQCYREELRKRKDGAGIA